MFKVHILGSVSSPNMDLSIRNKRLCEKWEAIWNRNNDPGWLSAPKSQVYEWGHLGSFRTSWALPADIMYPAAAAESLQPCPTLCDPTDGSPPGSPVPGVLQARTLEWAAIAFSNAWKWKWSRSVVSDSSPPRGLRPTRLLRSWDFPGKSTGVGCHCLLRVSCIHDRKEPPWLIPAWVFDWQNLEK